MSVDHDLLTKFPDPMARERWVTGSGEQHEEMRKRGKQISADRVAEMKALLDKQTPHRPAQFHIPAAPDRQMHVRNAAPMSWRGTLQTHERKHGALPVVEHLVLNGLFPETPRDVAEKRAFANQMGIDARYHDRSSELWNWRH
jgi:hypothetical protein